MIVEYVWMGDRPIAAVYPSGSIVYIITDHQNKPRRGVTSSGVVVWSWDPDAFGVIKPQAGLTNGVTINLRFPGQYYDAPTGLYYNHNRYYNPELGRYMEADPTGLAAGLNPYSYASNNPVNHIDPSGLDDYGLMNDAGLSNTYLMQNSLQETVLNDQINQLNLGFQNISNSNCLSPNCLSALSVAGANSSAVARANNSMGVIQQAASSNGINPYLLASIGIRETGFQNISQPDGLGRGVFQIDLGAHPSITTSQAFDIGFAANFSANLLAHNQASLASAHPNLTPDQLTQATAASYNFGLGNISGNPSTIDVGTAHNNYGSNVFNLMRYCFPPFNQSY